MQQDLHITTTDGYRLKATLFRAKTHSKGIIALNSGTCIRRNIYFNFAIFLSQQGYDTITYDYRGVGDSRPKSLKGFKARITDWGNYDIKAIIDWMEINYQDKKKYIIAHSMGGQIIGLSDNHSKVDKLVCVNSSYGNWRNFEWPVKIKIMLAWLILFPITIRFYGYFPASKFSKSIDFPKGVALDWWKWNLGNLPHHQLMEKYNIENYYEEVKSPMLVYISEDDHFLASEKIYSYFKSDYKNADLTIKFLNPSHYKIDAIGHMGFYSQKCEPIWKETLLWLENN